MCWSIVLCLAVGFLMSADRPSRKHRTEAVTIPVEEVRRVRAVVPHGWTVSVRGDTLHVRRDRPVQRYNAINLPELPPKEFQAYIQQISTKDPFELLLHFRPKLSLKEYERLRAENEAATRQLEVWRIKLRGVSHKFDDYIPSTPAEKRLVADYRAARRRLTFHTLPDFYTDQFSIEDTTPLSFGLQFTDAATGKEVARVTAQVHGLFRHYVPAHKVK